MNEWWLGLAPAQATVLCGGTEHRLRWDAGEFAALDHQDPEAERTLAALGGERCRCVDLLDAWTAHREDPRVLVLASRGQSDPLASLDDDGAQFGASRSSIVGGFTIGSAGTTGPPRRRRRVAHGPGSPGAQPTGERSHTEQAEDELITLLGLRGGLSARLVATVAEAWVERLERRDRRVVRVRPQLQAALHGRACAAIRSWLGEAERKVEVAMIGEGETPSLALGESAVRAELPLGWIVDVWSRELATIWGRFCLSATTADGRAWDLVTVGPDLGQPTRIRVELGD